MTEIVPRVLYEMAIVCHWLGIKHRPSTTVALDRTESANLTVYSCRDTVYLNAHTLRPQSPFRFSGKAVRFTTNKEIFEINDVRDKCISVLSYRTGSPNTDTLLQCKCLYSVQSVRQLYLSRIKEKFCCSRIPVTSHSNPQYTYLVANMPQRRMASACAGRWVYCLVSACVSRARGPAGRH